jgi:hypothetical protein
VCRTAGIDMFVCLTSPSLTACLSLLAHTMPDADADGDTAVEDAAIRQSQSHLQ